MNRNIQESANNGTLLWRWEISCRMVPWPICNWSIIAPFLLYYQMQKVLPHMIFGCLLENRYEFAMQWLYNTMSTLCYCEFSCCFFYYWTFDDFEFSIRFFSLLFLMFKIVLLAILTSLNFILCAIFCFLEHGLKFIEMFLYFGTSLIFVLFP